MRPLALAFGLALSALASGAQAQTPWRATTEGPSVSLDALYGGTGGFPITDDQGNTLGDGHTDSYLALLSARVPVGARSSVVGALPVTLYNAQFGVSVDGAPTGQTALDIGNAYVGFATRPLADAEVEAGVWLPTSTGSGPFTSDVVFAGFATDRENFEAYKTDVVSARLALRGEAEVGSAVSFRGEIAPVLSYYVGDDVTDGRGQEVSVPKTNAAATGALFTDVRLAAVSLTLGALGRYEPKGGTERYFDEVFASGLALVTYEGGSVHPSLGVRLPLRGTSIADYTIQAGVRVSLR